MKVSARSALMAGVATMAASAVVIAPSVQPPPPPKPEIQLTASSQVFQTEALQPLSSPADVAGFLRGILLAPGIGTPPPTPPGIPSLPSTNSAASFINNAYLAIEPWVRYGFEVGAWAFSWVPGIGWLAPQIYPIGYNLGERLIGSAVFNFTDWLSGNGTIISNVGDFGREAIDALVAFGIDQWNFWIGFPLPPLPGLAATETTTLTTLAKTAPADTASPGRDLLDGVTSPIKSSVTFGADVVREVLGGLPRGLAKQVDTQAVDEAAEDGGTSLAAPVENRINRVVDSVKGADSVSNDVVRAHDVRGPVGKAVTDAVDVLRGGKPNKDADDSTTPKSVARSLGDTARTAVNDVRQAAKDVRKAAKDTGASAKKGASSNGEK